METDKCDHCDINPVDMHNPEKQVAWCDQCSREDGHLIASFQLTDDRGHPLIYEPGDGAFFVYPVNVKKLQAIPKKGQQPAFQKLTEKEIVAATTIISVDPRQQFNTVWFNHYNSTVPGTHGYQIQEDGSRVRGRKSDDPFGYREETSLPGSPKETQ